MDQEERCNGTEEDEDEEDSRRHPVSAGERVERGAGEPGVEALAHRGGPDAVAVPGQRAQLAARRCSERHGAGATTLAEGPAGPLPTLPSPGGAVSRDGPGAEEEGHWSG